MLKCTNIKYVIIAYLAKEKAVKDIFLNVYNYIYIYIYIYI